jgi:hypothetical protein
MYGAGQSILSGQVLFPIPADGFRDVVGFAMDHIILDLRDKPSLRR